jgi:hypothetical protein
VREIEVFEITLPPPSGWNSVIVSFFPEILAEFRWKRFALLWRGSTDGFGAGDFHSRCDGHTHTLVVIRDTNGNIFGGFTPVEWDSGGLSKPDPSLISFIFTLKNPHKLSAQRFPLNPEKKDEAVVCSSKYGPHFCDIAVWDNCNSCNSNVAFFGGSNDRYINESELDGETLFTGSRYFQVNEIEVFEITS